MDIVRTLIISLTLSFAWASSSSIGSEFESEFSCSKFHFEEKVLEKLVRLEHKMQILEGKINARENSVTSKLDEINNIKKKTETFVQSVQDTQLQDQTRFNKSYQEIVELFKTQTDNETGVYIHQINTLLESLSSKIEVFTEAEKKRESVKDLMQISLEKEQRRFNSSYDHIVENFKVNSNKTLQVLIVNLQKVNKDGEYPLLKMHIDLEFKEMMEKRKTVAFSAYRSSSQTLSSGQKVIFDGVWINVGNGYEPSTGVFTAPHPGLYHLTAVVVSTDGNSLALYLCLNGLRKTRSYISGDGYKTGTFDVLFNLQKGEKIHIQSDTSQTIFGSSNKYITFSGYRIT